MAFRNIHPSVANQGRNMAALGMNLMSKKERMSMASGVMRTGNAPGLGRAVGAISKGNMILAGMSIVAKGSLKALQTLAKHSPALQQQMLIMTKAISLFLRPIGDIMAKFLRPMAQWMIKFAMKNLKDKGTLGNNSTVQEQEDLITQLTGQRETAVSAGDTERVKEIDEELSKAYAGASNAMVNEAMALTDGVVKVKDGVLGFLGTVTGFGSALTKGGKEGAEDIETASETAGTSITEGGASLKTAIESSTVGILSGATDFADNMQIVGRKLLNLFNKKGKDVGYAKLEDGATISDLDKAIAGKATGGDIQTSGIYNLHAGERVISAGENSRNVNSTNNINNTFNVQATINNELDIRILARKLAEYSERELRRRVSYI